MGACRINHVSILAEDIETSARFYEEVFGMRRLPTPRFPDGPVLWLGLGDQQLHLFERDTEPPRYHHFGLDVDDFGAVYARAKELGALDSGTWGSALRRHPAGWVQMYLRDPAGNLVEVDWPDASTLDRAIVTESGRLDEAVAQTGDAAAAVLHGAGGSDR
jgi:YD repeat-containing protein